MYSAELTPDASNDLLAMGFGPVKTAVKRILLGEDIQVIAGDEDLGMDIQVLPDDPGGWSILRVGSRVIIYRPLTEKQRADLGRGSPRGSGLSETVVARIIRLGDYKPFERDPDSE